MRSEKTSFIKDFIDDEEGSLIVFALVLMIPMLLVAGMAVDFMRLENERIVLQGVTDRAVLNAASLSQTEDPSTVITDFFVASGYDADQVTPNIVKDEASGREIGATGISEINTFYLRLGGIPTLATSSSSMAEEGVNNVEISLVLDYSGSMRFSGSTPRVNEAGTTRGRIGDLQDAARAFAAELLKPEFAGRFSLNIVPYAGQVNPGPDMFAQLNGADNPLIYVTDEAFDLGNDEEFILSNTVFWSDDANEGFPGFYVYAGADGDLGTPDDVALTPLLSTFGELLGDSDNLAPSTLTQTVSGAAVTVDAELFGPDEIYGTSDDNVRSGGTIPNSDLPLIAFAYDQQQHCMVIGSDQYDNAQLPAAGAEQVDVFMNWGSSTWEHEQQVMSWGWCPGDDMRIQYAVQDKDQVDDFFDKITLADGTGTAIGMKWGLALLDPGARDEFTALNAILDDGVPVVPDASLGRPADWDDKRTDKIIILMTDGNITDQKRLRNAQTVGNLQSHGGTTNRHNTTTTRQQFSDICTAAKGPTRDVEIYTIAFETGDSAADLMRGCASDPVTHFKEADGSALTEVFVDIARQITSLRLSQ